MIDASVRARILGARTGISAGTGQRAWDGVLFDALTGLYMDNALAGVPWLWWRNGVRASLLEMRRSCCSLLACAEASLLGLPAQEVSFQQTADLLAGIPDETPSSDVVDALVRSIRSTVQSGGKFLARRGRIVLAGQELYEAWKRGLDAYAAAREHLRRSVSYAPESTLPRAAGEYLLRRATETLATAFEVREGSAARAFAMVSCTGPLIAARWWAAEDRDLTNLTKTDDAGRIRAHNAQAHAVGAQSLRITRAGSAVTPELYGAGVGARIVAGNVAVSVVRTTADSAELDGPLPGVRGIRVVNPYTVGVSAAYLKYLQVGAYPLVDVPKDRAQVQHLVDTVEDTLTRIGVDEESTALLRRLGRAAPSTPSLVSVADAAWSATTPPQAAQKTWRELVKRAEQSGLGVGALALRDGSYSRSIDLPAQDAGGGGRATALLSLVQNTGRKP